MIVNGHIITNRVRETLQLEAEGKRLMSMMTFRSKEETLQVCQAVKIGMRMRDSQEQELTLFAVPRICETLIG